MSAFCPSHLFRCSKKLMNRCDGQHLYVPTNPGSLSLLSGGMVSILLKQAKLAWVMSTVDWASVCTWLHCFMCHAQARPFWSAQLQPGLLRGSTQALSCVCVAKSGPYNMVLLWQLYGTMLKGNYSYRKINKMYKIYICSYRKIN